MTGIVLLSLLIDAVIGDPKRIYRYIPHPVIWIGCMVQYWDTSWNKTTFTVKTRYILGGGMILGVSTITCSFAYLLESIIGDMFGYSVMGVVILAGMMSIFMAQRSLYEHVLAVVKALEDENMISARRKLAMIVGRNTENLDQREIVRATVESCSENFCDGVVAPVFWSLLLGLPGLVLYKTVNTCDSMVGYRGSRYGAFGWTSARVDDLLNWIPARISAVILFLSMYQAKRNYHWQDIIHDASQHSSPNAGWPEATAAYVLDLTLGGPKYYGTERIDLPWINAKGSQNPLPSDIYRVLSMIIRSIGLIWIFLFSIFGIQLVLEYVLKAP